MTQSGPSASRRSSNAPSIAPPRSLNTVPGRLVAHTPRLSVTLPITLGAAASELFDVRRKLLVDHVRIEGVLEEALDVSGQVFNDMWCTQKRTDRLHQGV